ncbi:MAG TPA: secondary thiamine-phosphate synthase enzyme YjbQ [Acidimicrobiia bacterium]|nr:secondary thiamine-phosphate synthase enzyme YjbQ [Acidimicrobiia bacterium]
MESTEIRITTGTSPATVDITSEVAGFVREKGDGLVSVFVPHATAGVAILETGAGSDRDLVHHLDTLFPRDDRWSHRHGSPGHGADHVMPAFVSPSVTIPVIDGRMALGTWQSIVLVDPNRDNANRRVRLSFLAG